jgi:hypothetical protein
MLLPRLDISRIKKKKDKIFSQDQIVDDYPTNLSPPFVSIFLKVKDCELD